jgi:hypothetical protein
MKKLIIILLFLSSIFVSGCLGGKFNQDNNATQANITINNMSFAVTTQNTSTGITATFANNTSLGAVVDSEGNNTTLKSLSYNQ